MHVGDLLRMASRSRSRIENGDRRRARRGRMRFTPRAASVEEAPANSKGREVPPSYSSRPLRNVA